MDDFDDQIFERAAQLVEAGWARSASALTAEGEHVQFDNKGATAFCTVGAVARALHERSLWMPETQSTAFVMLTKALGASVFAWNDKPERTQAEVAAFLRSVPAKVRGEAR